MVVVVVADDLDSKKEKKYFLNFIKLWSLWYHGSDGRGRGGCLKS